MRTSYTSVNGYEMTAYARNVRALSQADSETILGLIDCPIGLDVIKVPVKFGGRVYDKDNLIRWLSANNRDPLTNVQIEFKRIKLEVSAEYFAILLSLERVDDGTVLVHEFETNLAYALRTATEICQQRVPRYGHVALECVNFVEYDYYQLDTEQTLDIRYRVPTRILARAV
jgi:hypothetical protein